MDEQSQSVESTGKRIRQFLRDLFGSRIAEHLDLQIVQLRQDFELRLQEKDRLIASLYEERQLLSSKVAMYELTIMPHASRVGAEVVAYQKPTKPKFSMVDMPAPQSRWQKVQAEHEKQLAEEAKAEAVKAKETASEPTPTALVAV